MSVLANISRFISSRQLMHYIIISRSNKLYLLFAIGWSVMQFIIFKIFYPYPDFLVDSYNYIETARNHLAANVYPIGYGWFMVLLHAITNSDTFLIGVQYFILNFALGYFFFSYLYLYKPGKTGKLLLFITLFINPLFPYISNCILPDALFISLSVLLITQLMWMKETPKKSRVIMQSIIIGVSFTLNYFAIWYPLITLVGLVGCRYPWHLKMTGIAGSFIIIAAWVIFTKYETQKVTGVPTFSISEDWQLANNALYNYESLRVDTNRMPKYMHSLDQEVRRFFTTIPKDQRDLSSIAGSFYLIAPRSPLKSYMNQQFVNAEILPQIITWGKVAPLYKSYGFYLITTNTKTFINKFIISNAKNYLLPPLEKLDNYNLFLNTVPYEVQDWFNYTLPDVASVSPRFQQKLFSYYPSIFLFLNGCWLIGVCSIIFMQKFKSLRFGSIYFISLTGLYLLLSFLANIIAHPIVFRFEVSPLIFLISSSLMIFECLSTVKNEKFKPVTVA